MIHGFVKVAAATLKIKVADPVYNARAVCEELKNAYEKGAKIIVFPELCLTGYTCGDLFWQELLWEKATEALFFVQENTIGKDAIVFVGLPMVREGKLYNVAAVLQDGRILGLVPKRNIPTYAEFYEGRHFVEGNKEPVDFWLKGERIPFGCNLLFSCKTLPELVIGCEICEDLWVADAPGISHAVRGATVLVNLSASNETLGKDAFRELLVKSASARLHCGYVYASAGEGEATQDLVFGGHNLIAECGKVLAQSKHFMGETIMSDLDVFQIRRERCKIGEFGEMSQEQYAFVEFSLSLERTVLERQIRGLSFLPTEEEKERRCREILAIQSYGLKKKLESGRYQSVRISGKNVANITLAVIVTTQAFDMLGLDRKEIYMTTPGQLAKYFGVTAMEIAQETTPETVRETAGESEGASSGQLLINTDNMTELAVDMGTEKANDYVQYAVNAGVPVTLVNYMLTYYAESCNDAELTEMITELAGECTSQEVLFDFFLYYGIGYGFAPDKVFRMAEYAFRASYDREEILRTIRLFYKMFFAGQCIRSGLPEGPKVGEFALSPRGDWRMPSDACARIWLDRLAELK